MYRRNNCKLLTHFLIDVPFVYQRFSDIFTGCRNRILGQKGIISWLCVFSYMPLGTSMNRFNVFIAVSFFEKSSKFLFLVFHPSLQYAHVLYRNIFDTVGMIIVILLTIMQNIYIYIYICKKKLSEKVFFVFNLLRGADFSTYKPPLLYLPPPLQESLI